MHPLRLLSSFKEEKKSIARGGNLNDILRSIQTMLPLESERVKTEIFLVTPDVI